MNFITVTVLSCMAGIALGCLFQRHAEGYHVKPVRPAALALMVFIGVLRGR